jgi:hypothetical protein
MSPVRLSSLNPGTRPSWNTMPTPAHAAGQSSPLGMLFNGHQPSHVRQSRDTADTRHTDSGAHPAVDSGNISTKATRMYPPAVQSSGLLKYL